MNEVLTWNELQFLASGTCLSYCWFRIPKPLLPVLTYKFFCGYIRNGLWFRADLSFDFHCWNFASSYKYNCCNLFGFLEEHMDKQDRCPSAIVLQLRWVRRLASKFSLSGPTSCSLYHGLRQRYRILRRTEHHKFLIRCDSEILDNHALYVTPIFPNIIGIWNHSSPPPKKEEEEMVATSAHIRRNKTFIKKNWVSSL